VKEARPKEKLHIVLFHLYKILENAHYSDRKKISSLLGMGAGASYVGREDGITKGHKETLGVMYMFIILIIVMVSHIKNDQIVYTSNTCHLFHSVKSQ